MANQQENAVINVVINGQQAINTYRELNQARAEQFRLVQNLNRNAPNYAEQAQRLNELTAAQSAWRTELLKGGEAEKGFFSDLKEGFSNIGELIGKISAGVLIYKGVSSMLEGIKSVWNGSEAAFNEAAKSQAQLDAALRSTQGIAGQTKDSMNALAKAEMDKTAIDDDVINKGEEMLLTFSNIRGKIYDQAIPAIVDMTSALNQGVVNMENIQQTSILVGKALNDPIKGMTALQRVGVSLNEQQRENIKTLVETNHLQDAQVIILKELQKEFGGNAKAVADSEAGPMMKFETRIGNIQEAIGQWIVKGKSLAVDVLNPLLGWIEDFVSTPLSETLHEDQRSLLGLRVELESTNTTTERRHKLIEDLKAQYPGYLSQLDSDKVKNSDLLPILDKINQAFVLRIAYQSRAEKLDKAIRQEADAINETYDQKQKLIMQIGQIQQMVSEDGIKFTIKGNTEEEKAIYIRKNLLNAIQAQAKGNTELNNVLASNKYENVISGLNVYGNSLVSTTKKQKESHEQVKQMTDDLTKFKQSSGYNDVIPGADILEALTVKVKTLNAVMDTTKKGSSDYVKMTALLSQANKELKDGPNDPNMLKNVQKTMDAIDAITAPKSGKTKAQLDAEAKAAEAEKKKRQDFIEQSKAMSDLVNEFNAEQMADLLAKNDKEVKAAENKFDKLILAEQKFIDKSKGNKYSDPEAIAKHQAEIDKLTLDKKAQVNALKAQQEKEITDKVAGFNQKLTNTLATELQKERDNINAYYDGLVKDAGDNQDQVQTIEQGRAAALADAKINEEKRFQEEKKKIQAEGLVASADTDQQEAAKINKKYDDEIVALKAKFSEELQATQDFQDAVDDINNNRTRSLEENAAKDKLKKKTQESKDEIEGAKITSRAIFEIGARNREAEANAAIKNLEDKKNAELSNKNLTEEQRAAIEDKYAKQEAEVKKKQWEAEKQAAIVQAIINGAIAMTKVAAQTGILSFAFSPLIALETAAQIAIIASQKPPEFADGGILPDGPSHGAGGINLVGPYGKIYGQIEGGEPVLSKKTYANNKGVVDALLNSGGQSLNYDKVVDATTSREARRSVNTATNTPVAGTSSNTSGNLNSTVAAHADRLDRMERMFDKQLQVNKIPVVLSRRVEEQEAAKVIQTRNDANG